MAMIASLHSHSPTSRLVSAVGIFLVRPVFIGLSITAVLCAWSIASVQAQSEKPLRARAQLLSSAGPMSFPERMVVTGSGKTYLLDTDLSTLFVLENRNGKISRLCGPEKLSTPSDITVDRNGNVWVLSTLHSRISKLDQNCLTQTAIASTHVPLRIATNTIGELIILNGSGEHLFELYGPSGSLLRSFGARIDYQNETTNRELSDGCIAPDGSGGFFFSFNYPPLIRHYGRTGNLISEFKPESDIAIASPNVSVRKQGNATVVSSRYQILVLDMAADTRGRLYLLLSGKNKIPALTEGTQKLMIINNGRIIKKGLLENNFHRIAVANGRLFLLRNRSPFRLDEYPAL
jgi:hypothetical protein